MFILNIKCPLPVIKYKMSLAVSKETSTLNMKCPLPVIKYKMSLAVSKIKVSLSYKGENSQMWPSTDL